MSRERDKFSGVMWKRNDSVLDRISRRETERSRELSKLIDSILASGYGIACSGPSKKMKMILEAKEFARTRQPYYIEPFKTGWSKHYCERKDIWIIGPARVRVDFKGSEVGKIREGV